jgi:hypothetical protein
LILKELGLRDRVQVGALAYETVSEVCEMP